MKKGILALLMLTLVFVSCKKDDDEDKQITPTQANLTGSYKITAFTEDNIDRFNNSNTSLNYYQACDRDDVYTLNANLTYNLVDAGTQCSPANTDSGTWSLSGTTLTLDGLPGTITSWNGKTLVITETSFGTTTKTTMVKQ